MDEFGNLAWSAKLNRLIRQDDPRLLGVSTHTLIERAARAGHLDHATRLVDYYWAEMKIIGQALYTWIDETMRFGAEPRPTPRPWPLEEGVTRGVREFHPGQGDQAVATSAFERGEAEAGIEAVERMRLRWCSLHDFLVVWLQELLTSLARRSGEDAVLASVRNAYESIWRPRYAVWDSLLPLERLQLSVEGMRGHLSGPGRRGDVGILEEDDRFVMVMDPCGSCGVLRRGDPESGRPPWPVAGNAEPHPWTWMRTGVGWYASHSPIAMEFLWYERDRPPMRPLESCDSMGPCRWYIYKDPARTPPHHRERMMTTLEGSG